MTSILYKLKFTWRWVFLSAGVALIASGCGESWAKNDAVLVADSYFASLLYNEPERALPLYAESFFSNTTRKRWIKRLNEVKTTLGDFKRTQMINWRAEDRKYQEQEGTYIILVYEVTYSNHTANETLGLFRPNSAPRFQIVSHRIASPGLPREIHS